MTGTCPFENKSLEEICMESLQNQADPGEVQV